MSYAIVQPPFTLDLREMPKKELHRYFEWFMEVLPQRVDELTETVKQTAGFGTWEPDRTSGSLDVLGDWFAGQVEMRYRTQEELEKIQSHQVFSFGISSEELTNETFSLAMDSGMYLSQVFLKNYPSLQWEQPLANKKFVDYGQPVLVKFNPGPFNPVRMVVTLAYGIATKKKTGQDLRNIYNIWSKMVQ